jgi:hypothetical protein
MNTFISLLPKILTWTEIASLIVTCIGVLLKILHYQGAPEMLMVGLLTLATTYFLFAYTVVTFKEEKQRSFIDLLPMILRKVMFIGLSVYCVALMFTFLQLSGADQQMTIGLLVIAIGTGISMILILGNRERMEILQTPLTRCVAALVFYFILPYLQSL